MKLIGRLSKLIGSGLTMLCIATFLSQCVIGLTMWSRGILTGEKMARIQAVIADVDYHQIRSDLRTSARQATDNPKRLATNELLKFQQAALGHRASDIALVESRLRESGRRFEVQQENFNGKVANMENDVLSTTRGQLVRALKNMAPDQAKANMVAIIKEGGLDDVLSVVRQMTNAEQTKIFAEFQSDEEQAILNDLLQLMREKPAKK